MQTRRSTDNKILYVVLDLVLLYLKGVHSLSSGVRYTWYCTHLKMKAYMIRNHSLLTIISCALLARKQKFEEGIALKNSVQKLNTAE